MEIIRSSSNAVLKRVRAVQRGRERGWLLVEGERLVDDALANGLTLEWVLVAERRGSDARRWSAQGVRTCLVADFLMASLGHLKSGPGVLALVATPTPRDWDLLPEEPDALLVVVDGIQDPGNLGSIARTAEAAGACGLVVLPGGCRPWNEKALRGSMGSLLRLAVFEAGDAIEAWEALSGAGFRVVSARTRGGSQAFRFDWSGRVALWVSGETGLTSPELARRLEAVEGVSIPMAAGVESLNVTIAASVLLFAAGRVTRSEA